MSIWPESKVRFNGRRIIYPDGASLVMVSDRGIFRAPGWEQNAARTEPEATAAWVMDYTEGDPEVEYAVCEREGKQMELGEVLGELITREASQQRAMRRARSKLRDLARSNDFRWFVTLTLDQSKVDRYDIKAVTKKLNGWLDNAVRRRGLKYVLVPELHKNGAIHFHGFFNDVLPMEDSGTMTGDGGRPRKPRSKAERKRWEAAGLRPVFNLTSWRLGFSTAIELYGDRDAAVAYVCKYVTKAATETGRIGGRWYYSGGDLVTPRVEYFDADFDDALAMPEASGLYLGELGAGLAIYRARPEATAEGEEQTGWNEDV